MFEFEAQSPHAGLRERVDALADDTERADHLAGDRSDFCFARLLRGHDTDRNENARKRSDKPIGSSVFSAQKLLTTVPDMARL